LTRYQIKKNMVDVEFCLKEQQKKAVRQLYERKDLVSVLPTGFRKKSRLSVAMGLSTCNLAAKLEYMSDI